MLKAVEEIDNKNYSAAFELLQPLAEAGNPKAQLNLATLYDLGLGVAADGHKAVDLYLKVAEQNIQEEHLSSLAYNNLSSLYVCGCSGVAPNPEKARIYRKLSEDLGFGM
jgi:TPR repeat protein